MRKLLISMAAIGLFASPGLAMARSAAPELVPSRIDQDAKAPQLYICDGSAETRRAVTRILGPSGFVTAEDLQKANWSGVRCITEREYRRHAEARGR